MRDRRGSALIGVLLVLALLLVMGVGLLSQRANQYEEMRRANDSARARALAQAGLADVRLKLSKDPTFPPARPTGEAQFTYSEDVKGFDGQVVGSFTVVVDTTAKVPPFEVIRVISVGQAGGRVDPAGRYSIYGELDAAKQSRANEMVPNPTYYKWALFREQSRPVNLPIPPP